MIAVRASDKCSSLHVTDQITCCYQAGQPPSTEWFS